MSKVNISVKVECPDCGLWFVSDDVKDSLLSNGQKCAELTCPNCGDSFKACFNGMCIGTVSA